MISPRHHVKQVRTIAFLGFLGVRPAASLGQSSSMVNTQTATTAPPCRQVSWADPLS